MNDERPKKEPEVRYAPPERRTSNDPLAFVQPGDDPELDALLAELRADSLDGDPFNPDWKKIRAKRLANEARAASEAAKRRSSRKGLSPRWVTALMFTIAAPVVAMTIGLLYRRGPSGSGNVGETGAGAGAKTEAASATVTGTDASTVTDAGTDAGTVTDAGMSTGAGEPSGAPKPSSHGAAGRPKPGTKAGARDEDPYEPHPEATARPSATLAPAAPPTAPSAEPSAVPSAPPEPTGTDIW